MIHKHSLARALACGLTLAALATQAHAVGEAPAYSPSGKGGLSGAIIGVGADGQTFTPISGRPFNVVVTIAGTETCQVERYLNGAWSVTTVSAGGSTIPMGVYSASASETFLEPQYGVPYRLNATSGTGTCNYGFSQ
ncbi:MAG: hypothetical protein P4L64_11135 [Caulobacteraceae bacterium]|nr:hypothetical protein [Caulobacteraceae bacterium]